MPDVNRPEKYLLYLDMGDTLDQDQLDQLNRQLQTEILDQEVVDAGMVSSDDIPEGVKAAGAITWGAIAIEVLPTFLPGVVEFLKSWVNREETRNVKIKTQVGDKTVELEYSSSGIKADEVKELVSILSAGMREGPSAESTGTPAEETDEEEKLPVQHEAEVKEAASAEEVETSSAVEEKLEDKTEEELQDQSNDEKSKDTTEEVEEED